MTTLLTAIATLLLGWSFPQPALAAAIVARLKALVAKFFTKKADPVSPTDVTVPTTTTTPSA